jgi:hypothetical protein
MGIDHISPLLNEKTEDRRMALCKRFKVLSLEDGLAREEP